MLNQISFTKSSFIGNLMNLILSSDALKYSNISINTFVNKFSTNIQAGEYPEIRVYYRTYRIRIENWVFIRYSERHRMSKVLSNGSAGCRSQARGAFVPTAAVNYLHSVLLHNSVSEPTLCLETKRDHSFFRRERRFIVLRSFSY